MMTKKMRKVRSRLMHEGRKMRIRKMRLLI